jgi:DNA polymerase IV
VGRSAKPGLSAGTGRTIEVVSRRTIAHIDMDAFYVSVELLRRPELRGRPVIVSGTGPRAVVTTASYEARVFGVGSAMPASRARRMCPDAVWLAPDFTRYREVSRRVMDVLRELGVPIEPLSLDEAYLDLSALPDPVARMSGVVRRIREELGLDASVGIGPNKLVAKVASDAEKPRGFVVLTREQAVARFRDEPVTLIPGIGPKTAERLRRYGVTSLGQLQRCTVPGLIERFGENHGRALHERSHFLSDSAVSSHRAAKSRSVESTFDRDVADLERMAEIVDEQARRLARQLADRDIAGRTIGIKVRHDDFSTFTRVRSVDRATNDADQIARVALELLRDNAPERPVRLLGVRVAGFADEAPASEPETQALDFSSA